MVFVEVRLSAGWRGRIEDLSEVCARHLEFVFTEWMDQQDRYRHPILSDIGMAFFLSKADHDGRSRL